MDKDTRNAIERATQEARKLLERDFAQRLDGEFDVRLDGWAEKPGAHLDSKPQLKLQREKIVAALEHKRAAGMSAAASVADYLRDAAFTTLNRFVALKMLEARDLVQECITKGEQSSGYREFCGLAPGLPLLHPGAGYRLYLESLFDELSTEVKVLFDRRDPSSISWPSRTVFQQLLEFLNAPELVSVWAEDETIGWVYQYFNSAEDRHRARYDLHGKPKSPQDSRELAVRNQFFTPRYVVQFLTDNTLGRIWYEMRETRTALADRCEYLVRTHGEPFSPRPRKDPRDIRVLDPACGSGHFLLYAFDLLVTIYEEAHADPESPRSIVTGLTLAEDYPALDDLHRALPGLILAYNLHGVDIDARCAQIAQLALWMRAQRAFCAFNVSRSDRSEIRQSRIVLAEPLLADEQLGREFVTRLGDSALERVFHNLIEASRLAGDLGLLLEAETLVAPSSPRGHTGDLFAPPEERIRSALARFATEGERVNTRRRLFTEDAAQGLGLLRLAETKFDVVLMNPPFGEPTKTARQYITGKYASGANDIYAAFVLRFSRMLAERGRIGAITSRSFFVGRDLRAFRRCVLDSPCAHVELVLDLGAGVLDAMVETAAYVLGDCDPVDVRFLDLRSKEKTTLSINAAFIGAAWREIRRERFRSLPHHQFLYDISDKDVGALSSGTHIEPTIARVTKGLSTGDDSRFVRLRWEIVPGAQNAMCGWELFSKGGEYGWFGSDVHLLIKRHKEGAELAAHAERTHGNVALSRQSSTHYGRAAVTWSRRSQKGFSARRLRAGVCFSDKSPVIIPGLQSEFWIPTLMASLATDSYLDLIYAQSKFGSYETGTIKTLPVPDESLQSAGVEVMQRLFDVLDELDARDETCQLFVSPPDANWDVVSKLQDALSELESFLNGQGQRLSRVVVERTLEGASARAQELASPLSWLSYAMGLSLGRWTISSSDLGPLPPPLERLPILCRNECHRELENSPRSDGVPEWVADDKSANNDVVAIIRGASALSNRVLPVDEQVREAVRSGLFGWHLAQYSKSARKAPVYWQLAPASGRYSVWAYYHRLRKDSLFRLYNDCIAPKLRHEEQRLELLRSDYGASPSASQRKQVAAQESFVEELRAFVEEVKRVAPLWNPNFDDGVIINFAPLWRLVPHCKSWQKELKATWDALCEGKYDWAHLAMRLWPERVVPKCAVDRSLAIAHGLEEVFWTENGEGKWAARQTPTRAIDELVRERTSASVKAALDSLLEAPVAQNGTGRARTRRARAAGGA